MRYSGILLHISSLPSKYGIGTFGKEAYNFVDFLKNSGQHYWQILPLCPTSYGDSPYQGFCVFAGNPYFIDLDLLREQGLIKDDELQSLDFEDGGFADYEKIYNTRFWILEKAFERSCENLDNFLNENREWLYDYAFFMALKKHFGEKSWQEWDDDIRLRKAEGLAKYEKLLEKEIKFWIFLQYHFYKQWTSLKRYANAKNIKIIGDMPIYVALDSSDVWANGQMFDLDEDKKPNKVAGCPPDAFSATGQLWGNPLYNWAYMKRDNYSWWVKRIKHANKVYDTTRIDHFRGFDQYYAIPNADKTAQNGKWQDGAGYALFDAIKKELGDVDIIAEDLGFLTPSVQQLLEKTAYPGMKVLQFAFDSEDSCYLPHNYTNNCVLYTGTHDNDTTLGWFENSPKHVVQYAKEYLNLKCEESLVFDCIKVALMSVANTVIIPMQDYLELGSDARMNTPSTLGNNWTWRTKSEDMNELLAEKIFKATKLYKRIVL